ncbi:hypothetical protein [Streptomyces sp. NRRL F-5650]|uniref:hypothetical protein n=1 Tax=Streptomyces sp. NRRL F-5650 TaxID=1463868 RepID=UPI00068C586B|nr:hypothetical protein [Streptomyces sp. NRRL F-5650]
MTTTGTPTTGTPTTCAPATGTRTGARPEPPRYAWSRRGRHRRPRPRKVLLLAGGLALAAGALSLVRLLPEPPGDTGGGLRAGAAPRTEDVGGDTARDDRSAASGAADAGGGEPGPVPVATSVMGGLGGSPGPGLIPGLVPAPSTSGTPATGAPDGPDASGDREPGEGHAREKQPEEDHEREEEGERPRAPAPSTARPPHSDRPPPRPAPTTPPPAPHNTPPVPEPDDPGLCVPVIGLCVDLLTG